MLTISLWTSFEQDLSERDVIDIDKRLGFLRDVLEDAARQYDVEDVRAELDLNLHIYLAYFQAAGNERLSAWQIHEAWFNYHKDAEGIDPELASVLRKAYLQPPVDLRAEIATFLKCLDCEGLIRVESDAVIWLSFLDHLASRLLHRLSADRMKPIFGGGEVKS